MTPQTYPHTAEKHIGRSPCSYAYDCGYLSCYQHCQAENLPVVYPRE